MNTTEFLRSAGAIFAGLLTIVVTHTGVDHIMHVTGVFPPYGEPMTDPALYALALAYRIVLSIAGCYVTARLAPRHAMRHALILGGIGVLLSTAGAVAMWGVGPGWYPLALIVVVMPCAWTGGRIHQVRALKRARAA